MSVIEKLGVPCLLLKPNASGGHRYNFINGEIVRCISFYIFITTRNLTVGYDSIDNDTPPCVVYSKIYTLWQSVGGVNSGWGRPIADEQDLEDGNRCSIFEGGHIHCSGGVAQPFPAEDCTAKYKPVPQATCWNRMVRFPLFFHRGIFLTERVPNFKPPHFQRKWTQLSTVIHPRHQKPIVQS